MSDKWSSEESKWAYEDGYNGEHEGIRSAAPRTCIMCRKRTSKVTKRERGCHEKLTSPSRLGPPVPPTLIHGRGTCPRRTGTKRRLGLAGRETPGSARGSSYLTLPFTTASGTVSHATDDSRLRPFASFVSRDEVFWSGRTMSHEHNLPFEAEDSYLSQPKGGICPRKWQVVDVVQYCKDVA
nr:hypothetical protein CFP56_24637 [Quercus suber]